MRQKVLTNIMKLILLELIFFAMGDGYNILADGYNISYRQFSENLVRQKRHDSPEILHIKYHHHNTVKLATLRKVADSTLANSQLPIWNFNHYGGESRVYRLNHVQPIFYHGVNNFDAITYFPHTNTLHGVIDTTYYVEDLPLDNAGDPGKVDMFIHKVSKRRQRLNHRSKRMDKKHKLDNQEGSSASKKFKGNNHKDEPKTILYPEILLAVDVSSRINPIIQYPYEKNIMYVVSYWNAVDMLFRNLKRVDIRINIAGIFIGTTADLLSRMTEHTNRDIDANSHMFISDKKALDSLGRYFHQHDEMIRDSFDFLMWMTRASLIDEDVAQGQRTILGIAAPPTDCGGLHRVENFVTGKVLNRAVIEHDEKYADYQMAARELAHLMFVENDDVEVTHGCHNANCLSYDSMQSSGIMDPSNHRIDGCLMWSYCSEIHFDKYANSKSSCCLLNFPYRSLGSTNIEPLSVEKQCECYGLHTANSVHYQGNICHEPLKCANDHDQIDKVALPLDGTPCVNENHGFCKESKCIDNI